MIRRRPNKRASMTEPGECDALLEWVVSLPWVVERPRDPEAPDTRMFAVDCEPLGCRRIWLVTGLRSASGGSGTGLVVVLPLDAAAAVVADGEARGLAFLQDGYVLVTPSTNTARQPQHMELLLLSAYICAMSASSTTDIA